MLDFFYFVKRGINILLIDFIKCKSNDIELLYEYFLDRGLEYLFLYGIN